MALDVSYGGGLRGDHSRQQTFYTWQEESQGEGEGDGQRNRPPNSATTTAAKVQPQYTTLEEVNVWQAERCF